MYKQGKQYLKRCATVLASTVVCLVMMTGSALAITQNRAEGLANAQTDADCGSFLYYCLHTLQASCWGGNTNTPGVVQWWCLEGWIRQNKITGSQQQASRVLGYGPNGGQPLVWGAITYIPFGGTS